MIKFIHIYTFVTNSKLMKQQAAINYKIKAILIIRDLPNLPCIFPAYNEVMKNQTVYDLSIKINVVIYSHKQGSESFFGNAFSVELIRQEGRYHQEESLLQPIQ